MQHYEQELEELKSRLVAMAEQAHGAVAKAVRAVVGRDARLAEEVKAEDDLLDDFEVEIDDRALQVLSKAPVASQLRLVMVALKLSQNLERMGDEATTIARRAVALAAEPPLDAGIELGRMAVRVQGTIGRAIQAFVNHDVAAASALVREDKEIDELNREIHGRLTSVMVSRGETVERSLNLMVVAKSLERIADHAANIAEQVVFLSEARDIRHQGKGGTVGSG